MQKDGAEYYDLRSASDEQVGLLQKNFKPQGRQQYIRPFYWEWKPATDDCTFTKMNRASFCRGMEKHNLTRFLVVGDSISFMMAESFWGLVGDGLDLGQQVSATGVQHRIDCPAGEVLFSFIRNDRLSNTTIFEECGDRCIPWWRTYLDDERPTLLLVNTGIHTHSLENFTKDFDGFTSRLAGVSHLRQKDRVYFRLTLPGHGDCTKYTSPFKKIDDFSLDTLLAKLYTWDLVPAFNEHVKKAVADFAASQSLSFTVLDPYIMTVLRPDGHRGDLGDCLHYYLPGAPDWWNHLLATVLLE